FFFQAEDGIRYFHVTGVQTCALPISPLPVHGFDVADLPPNRLLCRNVRSSVNGEIKRLVGQAKFLKDLCCALLIGQRDDCLRTSLTDDGPSGSANDPATSVEFVIHTAA